MRASSRKVLIATIGAAILVFITYRSRGLFHFGDFSGAKLLDSLRQANPYLLALCLVASYGCYAIRSLRWEVFQRNLGPSHFWRIYAMTLAGFSAIFLLGRAGEPARPILLARKEKLPLSGMFGIFVLERIFDAASAAVIAAIGLLLYQSHAHAGGSTTKVQAAAKTTRSLLVSGGLFPAFVFGYLRFPCTPFLEPPLQQFVPSPG